MDKVPDYKFVDELSVHNNTTPIEILSGEYSGIVYRYGKIGMKELDDGNISVNMDIEIVKAPENFNQQESNFTQTIGEIFVDIVEKSAPVSEPVDLEDDVHQDVDKG